MKSLRQRVQSAAHHGLRWFVRLRMWVAVLFVLVFGVYELTRQYQTDLVSLPKVMQQDVSDWIDDAVMGKSYLEKDAEELGEWFDSNKDAMQKEAREICGKMMARKRMQDKYLRLIQ